MKSRFFTSMFLILVVALTSCVSSKKFKSAQNENKKLQSDLSSCNSNVSTLTSANKNATAQIADMKQQVASLSSQNAALSKDAMAYQQIQKDEKARREALDAALAAQGTSLEEIKTKLITALSQFNDAGIDVTAKEGLIFVSLPEKLLFKEGSAGLENKPKDALSSLASILNDYPRVQIYVIGHTDTLTIHTARFQDNWSLSTERANSIVRVFRDKYKVDPARLLAAGRSKYGPVASNATKEGRAMNRRIQIVLNPGLNKLLDMVD